MLNAHVFGKPEVSTYNYADSLLQGLSQASLEDARARIAPQNVWMIGDNPFSDISGAFIYV